MLGKLIGLSLGGIPVKWLLAAGAVAAIVFSIWQYGNGRYNAGVAATDAKWEEASDRLKADAAKAESKADKAAAKRETAYAEKLEQEKERIDEAQSDGSSPFDVMFAE